MLTPAEVSVYIPVTTVSLHCIYAGTIYTYLYNVIFVCMSVGSKRSKIESFDLFYFTTFKYFY